MVKTNLEDFFILFSNSQCWTFSFLQAIGDNATLNTVAIQTTIDSCISICFHGEQLQQQPLRAVVYVPKGMFRTGSLLLRSNLRFHIGKGASIYGSDDPADYPIRPMLPNGYNTHKREMFRALFAGYNLENVSITGENYGYPPGSLARFFTSSTSDSTNRINGINRNNDTNLSVIDGVGWKWWCKAGYVRSTHLYSYSLRAAVGLKTNSIETMKRFYRLVLSCYLHRFLSLRCCIVHLRFCWHTSYSSY